MNIQKIYYELLCRISLNYARNIQKKGLQVKNGYHRDRIEQKRRKRAFSTIRETTVLRIVEDKTEETVGKAYQNGQVKEGETDATFQTDLSGFSGRTK